MRYRYIDVLKAFAIIAVVLYHSGMLNYGYLGVDIFLVISGYFTTRGFRNGILASQPNWGGYFQFELSRIVRLLPILLVAGLICMIVGYFTMLPDDYENLSESVIATNFFSNNILAALTIKNYWAVVNDYKPLMHTWYVGVIMQFYLIYPLLLFLSRIDKRNSQKTILVLVSSLAVCSLLIYLSPIDTSYRFYYLPSRFFEFAAGGIVALSWNPQGEQVFHKWFVYICYLLLLVTMVVNNDVIPANLKLVIVVALSVVLIMSPSVLENGISANGFLAKIGAASFSIFVWHQVVLAFYRYIISSHFTILTYSLLIVLVALLSWFTYHFIEQKTGNWLKMKRRRIFLYLVVVVLFVGLTGFSGFIYKNAGIVRDIPELYVSMKNKHRGIHAEYCDRGYLYDKPFVTDKPHWLVIGNSFGRDFVNVIIESNIADKVEVSYLEKGKFAEVENRGRFKTANRVFISTLGLNESFVSEVEAICMACGLELNRVTIVGEKDFGESNGQVYAKRNRPDYFDQYIPVKDKQNFIDRNSYYKNIYGDRFLDLMSFVTNDKGEVRVFTPDHHYISADCRHYSKGGAIYIGSLIDWEKYLLPEPEDAKCNRARE